MFVGLSPDGLRSCKRRVMTYGLLWPLGGLDAGRAPPPPAFVGCIAG